MRVVQLSPQYDRQQLEEYLQELVVALTEQASVQLQPQRSAPENPQLGMIVYANGVTWNPGSGQGFYGYTNSGWAKLHA